MKILNNSAVLSQSVQPWCSADYAHIETPGVVGNGMLARFSSAADDGVWDDFLSATAQGHFQQSSHWARAKAVEGWQPVRVILTRDKEIVGGFQMLSRPSRLGRIGYISKGPVLTLAEPAAVELAFDAIFSAVRREKLRALIVQVPDEPGIEAWSFVAHRFAPNHLVQVISATLLIDTAGGMEDIRRRMRRTTTKDLKRAEKRGVKIREGTEADLGTFFRLMTETCRRQNTAPSPASEAALLGVWNAFRPQDAIRLTLAELEGEPVAGILCLCFGNRVTAWKKGWSGAHGERQPNQLVMFEAIQWSHRRGYHIFDCTAMNRSTAESLLNGNELSDDQKRGRDFFLLGYGGRPVLLPESWVYFANPVLRCLYRFLGGKQWIRALARRLR